MTQKDSTSIVHSTFANFTLVDANQS